MELSYFEHLIDLINKLRKNKEFGFIISRIQTQLQFQPGEVWKDCINNGDSLEEIQHVLQILTPVIMAIASEDESLIENALIIAVHQIKNDYELDLEPAFLRNKIEPSVSPSLKKTYFHRTSSQGNLILGSSSVILSRHNHINNKQYPFVQLRFDYLDNNQNQPQVSYTQFDLTKNDLISLRASLDNLIGALGLIEEDEQDANH